MKIPSQVKVGGHTYKVIRDYEFKELTDTAGQCDHEYLEIRLNRKRSDTIYLWLVHEIIHAINRIYNMNKLDEETVTRLAQGFYQVILDNPEIFKGK